VIGFLAALGSALAGGALFAALGVPVPWLLGPMVVAFAGTRLFRRVRPVWPRSMRNIAMVAIGYSLGLSFTKPILREMGEQLPTMLLMSALLMLLCLSIAWLLSRISGLPFRALLMGCIPGGLSQMLILAEETPGIDMTLVTFLQTSRLMMIILCVPLLIYSPVFGGVKSEVVDAAVAASTGWGDLPILLLYAAVCVGAGLLGHKIKFPAALLLGPMIATAVLNLSGVPGPALPTAALDVAQLLIGTYVGLLLRPEQLDNKLKVGGLALLSGITLIAGALGLSYLLTRLHPISSATAFLGMAPGGMDQMGFIGKEVHADIAIVTVYQLFRTWFIFFAVIPLMRLFFRRKSGQGREAVQ